VVETQLYLAIIFEDNISYPLFFGETHYRKDNFIKGRTEYFDNYFS
jgi:hypothetical protein